eukprot:404342-Rhodomonas_salina.1
MKCEERRGGGGGAGGGGGEQHRSAQCSRGRASAVLDATHRVGAYSRSIGQRYLSQALQSREEHRVSEHRQPFLVQTDSPSVPGPPF